MSDQHLQLSELAYHSWLRRGCPMGSPEVDWEHAVQELQKRENEKLRQASGALIDSSANTETFGDTKTQEFGRKSSRTVKDSKEEAVSRGDEDDTEVRIQSDTGLSKNVADTAPTSAKRERDEQDAVQKVSRPRARSTPRVDRP